jgi:hypothetical protein
MLELSCFGFLDRYVADRQVAFQRFFD